MRGGGPRYAYNFNNLKKLKGNVEYTASLNNVMYSQYRDDFMNFRYMNKTQLHLLTGIELYYGNFEELKYIFASNEVPELAEYMNKIAELDDATNSMTGTVATQGLSVLQDLMKDAKRLTGEVNKLKNVLLGKTAILVKYGITEDDIEELYSKQ